MTIGAGIHVAYFDFWNKFPPLVTWVEPPSDGEVTPTGRTVEITKTFVESADFRSLGFDKVAGQQYANPDIVVDVGDKVIITAINGGKLPHAFGVVSNPDDPNTVVFDARVKSANDPLLKGEQGIVEFIPNKAGEFFYICLIPGHAAQGMQGKFVVEER